MNVVRFGVGQQLASFVCIGRCIVESKEKLCCNSADGDSRLLARVDSYVD